MIRILLVFLFFLLLCACNSGQLVVESQPAGLGFTSTPGSQATLPSPSFTAVISSPTPSYTPAPTTLASPTASATPTQSPTPTVLACWDQGGRYEHDSLRNPSLPLPMEYAVYLPPCYDEQPGRRYPVLYMIHGQNYNHDQWDRLGIDETADSLIAAGEIPPLIIVLPRDRSWAQPTEDPFGQVLVENLVPHIDESYRTLPERIYRAVGGLSRGAGWAVHLGLSRWQTFGAFGAHSLPVFWTDTNHIRAWIDAIPDEEFPRIYLDIGEKDRPNILNSAIWFENLLNEKGVPHEWYLFPGYHEEAYWQAHLPQYLRWYTREW